jgi:hypothetical protein
VSGSNGVLRWWVNGRLVGQLSRPLPTHPVEYFGRAYVGRSNWKGDDFLNGNVYYFSALNAALSPQQVNDISNELLESIGRPPVESLGNNVRFVRILAPTQGDSWLQISQLQV